MGVLARSVFETLDQARPLRGTCNVVSVDQVGLR
jgi:hypothetical protein